jgi:hypothetical protein
MLRKILSHLTYANAVSSMALFLAVGGVSYAAITLPKNSVGAAQIKKNAVTAAKVRNGSLTPNDFKKGQLPAGTRGGQGPQGARGPSGARGATGSSGVSGAHVVSGATTTIVAAGDPGTATVTCPAGEHVLSGNYGQEDGIPSITVFRTAIIDDGTTFQADGQNDSGSGNRKFWAYAVCAA